VLDTVFELPKNRFAQQFSDLYSNIVRGSVQREIVLRAFASSFADDISTSEVCQIVKTKLGVKNPSSYKAQLSSPQFGSVIYTPVGRHRGTVRFSNPIFQIYIRLRPSIYKDVDRNVRSAFIRSQIDHLSHQSGAKPLPAFRGAASRTSHVQRWSLSSLRRAARPALGGSCLSTLRALALAGSR
jgi:hypothetical protein